MEGGSKLGGALIYFDLCVDNLLVPALTEVESAHEENQIYGCPSHPPL